MTYRPIDDGMTAPPPPDGWLRVSKPQRAVPWIGLSIALGFVLAAALVGVVR